MSINYLKHLLPLWLLVAPHLIIGQTTEIWGVASDSYTGNGIIFKADSNGNFLSIEYSFKQSDGWRPDKIKLLEASDGYFYGVTQNGGAEGYGVLFRYDRRYDFYKVLHQFAHNGTTGYLPEGGLMEDTATKKLFGLTKYGGNKALPNSRTGYGVLFSFDLVTQKFQVEHFFSQRLKNPYSRLLKATNGYLYGFNSNTVFKFNPSNSNVSLVDSLLIFEGRNPVEVLCQYDSTTLYGTCERGGLNDTGSLFKVDLQQGLITKVLDFKDKNGAFPSSGLQNGPNNLLLGVTKGNLWNKWGVMYTYNPKTGNDSVLFEFIKYDLGEPFGQLHYHQNGKIYGTTSYGGNLAIGVVFEYDYTLDSLKKLGHYNVVDNGFWPKGAITLASNGNIYGTTELGGKFYAGVMYEYDTQLDTLGKLYHFDTTRDYGIVPHAGVELGANGRLYGTTSRGGKYDVGILYEYSPTLGAWNKKIDFDHKSMNGSSNRSLALAGNGLLYGTLKGDSAWDYGGIYEYDPNTGNSVKIFQFDGKWKGKYPRGALELDSNGVLYGVTSKGGTFDDGTLYAFYPQFGVVILLSDFRKNITGADAIGDVYYASDGHLYGLANAGGKHGNGVIYGYDPLQKKLAIQADLNSNLTGTYCTGGFIEANGWLYTMTTTGGQHGYGTIIKFNPQSKGIQVVADFDSTNLGSHPKGKFLKARNGKLYGFTTFGGKKNAGIVFELDPKNDSIKKKFEFDGSNGLHPQFGQLIEVPVCLLLTDTTVVSSCDNYLWSTTQKNYTTSGLHFDTLTSQLGCDSLSVLNLNIRNSSYMNVHDTGCYFYNSPNGQYIWDSTGIYQDTLTNIAGCDSVIDYHIYIEKIDTSVIKTRITLIAKVSGAQYQWLDCNDNMSPILGETFQSFTVLDSGRYALQITNTYCTDTSACQFMRGLEVSTSESTFAQSFKLYPNPTKNEITLDFGKVISEAQVFVRNSLGQEIHSDTLNHSNGALIPIDGPPGIYFVSVITESKTVAHFRVQKI